MAKSVKNIAWRCEQCGKRRWLKPGIAKGKRYCSRPCLYASMRVENPVRAKQAQQLARYGVIACGQCSIDFELKAKHQKFCSQDCSIRYLHERRRVEPAEQKPCEHCGMLFVPRKWSAGRFCSRPCNFAGQSGSKAAHWKGGRYVTKEGYVRIYRPDHPAAHGRGGYVAEHRIVMEGKLGRLLERHETVHHINGDKGDNREENLQLRNGRHGKHQAFRCLDCGSSNVMHVPLD